MLGVDDLYEHVAARHLVRVRVRARARARARVGTRIGPGFDRWKRMLM